MPEAPPTLLDALRTVRAFVNANWPGLNPTELIVKFGETERELRLPIFGIVVTPSANAGGNAK